MAGFSDYMEGEIIKWTLRPGVNPDFAQPANVYVALFTTLPAEAGTGGVEVSGGSYARQIGTLRVALRTPAPAAAVLASIANDAPQLCERLNAPLTVPFPLMTYVVDRTPWPR